MSLTSLIFALFCIIVIVIYFIIPKKFQWIVLLVSSIFFLFYKNLTIGTILQALIILLASYVFGILIDKSKDIKKKKRYLIIGILLILGVLLYLKYTNLFLVTCNHFFNLFKIDFKFNLVTRNSLVGLSYYSLIMIGYLVDIYRGGTHAEKNIFKCALFMSYFPILNSGPFIKYNDIKEDLYGGHKFDYDRMCRGLLRVVIGIFKILVISERMAYFVNTVYGNLSSFIGIYIFLAALIFLLQLYTNFSGSIDVIMGISEVIGIKLPENFNTPFFSKTVTELWRRWHITLGLWLKNYIFYPLLKSDFMQKLNKRCKDRLGKKVGKKIPLYLSMFIMWFIIGAWHNGAYTFIIGSGILQFIIMILEDTLEPVAIKITNKLKINRNSIGYRIYQMIRTYLLFSFTMIFFRATSVSNAIEIIKSMFVNHYTKETLFTLSTSGGILEFLVFIASIISLFIIEIFNRKDDIRNKILNHNIVVRWGIIYRKNIEAKNCFKMVNHLYSYNIYCNIWMLWIWI